MGKRLKIAVAGLYHETNSFAPGITDIDAFKGEWVEGKEEFYHRYAGSKTSMGGAITCARLKDVELIPSFYTSATPSGTVSSAAVEQLIQLVVDSVPDQMDGLLIILHGAMVSETILDVEAEVLRRFRDRFSDSLPIAITLDLHANISRELVEGTDILVGYDTYPHVDAYERAMEAMELLIRLTRSEIKPHRQWEHSRMLIAPQTMITNEGVMSELMQRAFEMEKNPAVLN